VGLSPTDRFSSRVDDYVRYRPSYPPEIIPLLERECGLTINSTIADIGSGTGLLAKLFLRFACRVFGVEPNAEMRRAGEEFLAEYERFCSINARAEHTGLPEASVDLITAGQAFHWFDPAAAHAEFQRILRAPRWVVLIWNERLVDDEGFLFGYERLLERFAPEYKTVDHRRIGSEGISAFFGHQDWKLAQFDNHQDFDFAGVRGRLLSSSYAPQPGSDAYLPMMEDLDRLFSAYQRDNRVRFLYQTNVYFGKL